jgi:hypothetical protein
VVAKATARSLERIETRRAIASGCLAALWIFALVYASLFFA